MELQKLSGFGINDCLTEASLGWEYLETYNKDPEFHTFLINMLLIFFRKSIKSRGEAAFKRFFESN